MKKLIRKLCFIGVFLFVSFCFTGCMTSGGRLYSGDLRSNQEVAILVIHQDLDLRSFSGGERQLNSKFTYLKIAEVLPESYDFCVALNYNAAGGKIRTQGCIRGSVNAQAGHVYYIHYSSDLVKGVEGSFRAWIDITDIANDTDYEKIKEGNKVKSKVNEYLKGQRAEINS